MCVSRRGVCAAAETRIATMSNATEHRFQIEAVIDPSALAILDLMVPAKSNSSAAEAAKLGNSLMSDLPSQLRARKVRPPKIPQWPYDSEASASRRGASTLQILLDEVRTEVNVYLNERPTT